MSHPKEFEKSFSKIKSTAANNKTLSHRKSTGRPLRGGQDHSDSNIPDMHGMEAEQDGEASNKREQSDIPVNMIRITVSGKERHYIGRAMELLSGNKHETVFLAAMGSGINKCIAVAEILKRRVAGLHQWNQIKSIHVEKQPGSMRPVSHMTITLSLSHDALEQSDILGYQPPLSPDMMVMDDLNEGKGRPFGGRSVRHSSAEAGLGEKDEHKGKGGGRNRGRGGGKGAISKEQQ